MATTMTWIPIKDRPAIDHQPIRQFIRIEGSREHSGLNWGRVWCGEAFIRRPGRDGELLQYRSADIVRLCQDGDMDLHTAEVTHWMPAAFPNVMDVPQSDNIKS